MNDEPSKPLPEDMSSESFGRAFWNASKEEQRAYLVKKLRALDVAIITAEYDGYGDEGNVHDYQIEPRKPEATANAEFGITEQLLIDFIWAFCYRLHPGFDHNEGGYGSFEWNVVTNKIDVTHHDRYVESATTVHESL